MKWLTNFKSFIFAFIFTTIGVISWGQTPHLTVSSTEDNTYLISSVDDWHTFASDVNGGYSYSGKIVKLTESINASNVSGSSTKCEMVGNYYYAFSGTFDGDNYTLTFNYEADGDDSYVAPFYYTEGATIKNLTVNGTIASSYASVAGLIYSTGSEISSTKVQYVTVSVNIDAAAATYCGGFSIYSSYLEFSNCVYNGKIKAGNNSGGFCGSYGVYGTMEFENCIFNPTIDSSIGGDYTFGAGSNVTITNCYHTMQVGSSTQGQIAYKTEPEGKIWKPFSVHGTTVYIPVAVNTSIEETYFYDSGIDYYSTVTGCTVTFDGTPVVKDTDYTVSVKKAGVTVTEVKAVGEYQLVIEGKGDYHGSYSKNFYVIDDFTEGDGTSGNPYIISSIVDWLVFVNKINTGAEGYATAYYKLTDDITVSTMVGTSEHPFKGHFSGQVGATNDTKTLTFNYGTSGTHTEEEIVAPFRYTDGATIEFLQVSGAIYTKVGKQAGLIGVNKRTSTNTNITKVVIRVNFYCNEALWDSEGGGVAYDGSGITFNSCAYQGLISTNNYHGGICGKANSNTELTNCLFNPSDGEGSIYWAQNFVYDEQGATLNYTTCYYSEGNNHEESTQGTMVYVDVIPYEKVGRKITELYGKAIYVPVTVVIGNVSSTYLHTGSVITITPSVTFDGNDAIANNYCTTEISPNPVQNVGTYTLTVSGRDAGEGHIYSGATTKDFRVVNSSSEGWNLLQTKLSGSDATITLDKDYTAGALDAALTIDRTLTINLNEHTIDRGLFDKSRGVDNPQVGGQVFRIGSGATVIINGPGKITGGNNVAENTTEHSEFSDGGGIWNMGSLTLNNVTVEYNKCNKYAAGTSRTARGGGIYSGIGSTLIINGGTITHNEAKGGGGGLYAEKAQRFSINEDDQTKVCNIQSNTSEDKGGGLRVDASKAAAVIKKCNITYNNVELHNAQSASYGGGIHLDAGTLNLTNCEISNNNSTRYGGGIYMMNGTINATNCDIKYNMSYDDENYYSGYGGGVCIMGGKFNMDGGMVYGNSSYIDKGGGVFVNNNTTFSLKGEVFITGNWKIDQAGSSQTSTTNVYIMNKSGVITIKSGFGTRSRIGVAKSTASGWTPVFTSGLYSNGGTISNFVSDNSDYTITRKDGEAKFSKPEPWNPASSGYVINDTWTVNSTINAGANTITFGTDGCLVIVDEGEGKHGCLTAKIENDDFNKIVINGGELITTSENVKATSIKSVLNAYDFGQNWYVISTPFNNPPITMGASGGTNLITHDGNGNNEYDLYRFNEAATATDEHGNLLQWENYRAGHADFTTLENGRGYLYRNENNYTAVTRGTLNVEDVTYTLSYAGKNIFKGFHLIGNPFSHNIYKNDEYQAEGEKPAINDSKLATGYYRLVQGTGVEEDRWVAYIGYNNPIKPMEGVLVQATEAHSMTITKTTNGAASSKDRSEYDNIRFEVSNSTTSDVAYAMFSEGHGLRKIEQLNEQTPMLYIRRNNEDYAIATLNDNVKAFNLNFEAKTTGRYTLSVKPEGEFSYLHLIDKVAGEDIDLFQDSEYNFIGSPNDLYSRFIVKLSSSSSSTGNETFAYQSGNDIVVTGEGELQVFDVMGRMVMRQNVNGVETVNGLNKGVYIMRLNDKTQKIVIR